VAYLKPGQHDLFVTTAATLTNFDQPVLAYKCWCRVILNNNSGLKSMQKYSTVYTKNDVKHSTLVVQPALKYGKNNS